MELDKPSSLMGKGRKPCISFTVYSTVYGWAIIRVAGSQ